jgi:hypothetical protein
MDGRGDQVVHKSKDESGGMALGKMNGGYDILRWDGYTEHQGTSGKGGTVRVG